MFLFRISGGSQLKYMPADHLFEGSLHYSLYTAAVACGYLTLRNSNLTCEYVVMD